MKIFQHNENISGVAGPGDGGERPHHPGQVRGRPGGGVRRAGHHTGQSEREISSTLIGPAPTMLRSHWSNPKTRNEMSSLSFNKLIYCSTMTLYMRM